MSRISARVSEHATTRYSSSCTTVVRGPTRLPNCCRQHISCYVAGENMLRIPDWTRRIAGTQKMNGCCVSYRVWAYAFGSQRWDRLARQNPILRHKTVYPESGQWLFDLIQEAYVA